MFIWTFHDLAGAVMLTLLLLFLLGLGAIAAWDALCRWWRR
jgi:hypothetical protein